MFKVYLATSFSTRVDEQGNVHPHFKEHIESIIRALEAEDFEIFCAVKHEGWKVATHYTPGQAVAYDLREVEKADLVLAVLHEDASRGVQYEMGYAAGLGKKVVAATQPGDELAYFNQGLIEIGAVKQIVYKSAQQLARELKESLSAE